MSQVVFSWYNTDNIKIMLGEGMNDWNDKEEIAKRFSTILKKHFDF